MNRPHPSIAVLAAALVTFAATVAEAKPRMPASNSLHQVGIGPGALVPYITLISADFEVAEGFTLAPLHGQNGCQTSGPNFAWASVSNVHPATGAQHLRIIRDGTFDGGSPRLALTSPTGLGPYSPTTTTQLISISNDGGADYHVVGQTPSQNLIAWHVAFSFSDDTGFGPGTIYIVHDFGGELDFLNTHARWTQGTHVQLKVQFDPPAQQIRYYYGGRLIHTGTIFAATTVEQVVWISDNWQLAGEYADIDQLTLIDVATDPTDAERSSWGRIKAAYHQP